MRFFFPLSIDSLMSIWSDTGEARSENIRATVMLRYRLPKYRTKHTWSAENQARHGKPSPIQSDRNPPFP